MFSSANKLLREGEEIQETVNPSRLDSRFSKDFIASIIFLIGVVALTAAPFTPLYSILIGFIPIGGMIYLELKRRFVMYHFTGEQVIEERGILDKTITSIRYSDITHTELKQDLEERIFNVNDIHIDTAGKHDTEIILNGIKNAPKYKKFMDRNPLDSR